MSRGFRAQLRFKQYFRMVIRTCTARRTNTPRQERTMGRQWRKSAIFYAKLATLPTLEALPAIEKKQLEDAAKLLGNPWPSPAKRGAERIEKSRKRPKPSPVAPESLPNEQLVSTQRIILWEMIHKAHPYARRWISELIDTGRTDGMLVQPGELELVRENQGV